MECVERLHCYLYRDYSPILIMYRIVSQASTFLDPSICHIWLKAKIRSHQPRYDIEILALSCDVM
jgi:hypothetical protein